MLLCVSTCPMSVPMSNVLCRTNRHRCTSRRSRATWRSFGSCFGMGPTWRQLRWCGNSLGPQGNNPAHSGCPGRWGLGPQTWTWPPAHSPFSEAASHQAAKQPDGRRQLPPLSAQGRGEGRRKPQHMPKKLLTLTCPRLQRCLLQHRSTPLHMAAAYGFADVARELVRHGANLQSKDQVPAKGG